jgi:hypothetical protein
MHASQLGRALDHHITLHGRMHADRLLLHRERSAGVYGSFSFWVSSLGGWRQNHASIHASVRFSLYHL